MRGATGLAALALVACTDVRDFRGTWTGDGATLVVSHVDDVELDGTVALGFTAPAPLRRSTLVESDAIATLTFAGSPLKVYLAYFDPGDGCGEALAVISLHEGRRMELRAMRGAGKCGELFGRFALNEAPP